MKIRIYHEKIIATTTGTVIRNLTGHSGSVRALTTLKTGELVSRVW
jgi:hypothetical protein